jgi:hypothetical protein
MKFVLNRNYKLRSTSGHMLDIVKGVPFDAAALLANELIAVGAECLDGPVDVLGEEAVEKPQLSPADREAAILAAMSTMQNGNARNDFTAQGLPNVKRIEAIVGFDIDTKERDALWTKLRTGE